MRTSELHPHFVVVRGEIYMFLVKITHMFTTWSLCGLHPMASSSHGPY